MSATIETDAWTEGKIARLKALWKQGAKKPQIALELNVTENAITGKVYRLGLTRDRKHESPTTILAKKVKPAAPKRAVATTTPKVPQPPRLEPMSKRHMPRVDSPNAKVWSARTPRECAFPIGEPERPALQICCGNQTVPGTPYCDGHNGLMFQPSRR